MNEEFSLSEEPPVQGSAIKNTREMVSQAISKVMQEKTNGSSVIVIEIIKAAGNLFLIKLYTRE